MTNLFIDPGQVKDSINYFKNLNEPKEHDNHLGIFLVLKRLGISMTNAYNFDNRDTISEFNNTMWTFSGIFGNNETGDDSKHAAIFPNCFTKGTLTSKNYFNGGTVFSRERGRVRDFVRNQEPRLCKQSSNNQDLFTLNNDYLDILHHQILNNNKISFFNFAVWLLRFQSFPVSKPINNQVFTRIIRKYARNYIHLDRIEFHTIFKNDFPGNIIDASTSSISGHDLRNAIGINQAPSSARPDKITSGNNADTSAISESLINRFSKPTGDNPTSDEITNVLNKKKQILLVGVPGVGKTYYIKHVSNKFSNTVVVQFHPDFSYQDFIGGNTLSHGTVESQKGIFLKSILEAKKDPNHKHLFVIDEINRGNIPAIFGETIEILDRGYTVRLSHPIDHVTKLQLPNNFYIIGAMNNNDRSIASLDFALRRRFAFIELKPNYELVSLECKYDHFDMGAVLETINDRLTRSTGDPSKLLGQSYFLPKDPETNDVWSDEDFKMQFNTMILPTIKDYASNDVSIINNVVGSELADTLFDTDEFKRAFFNEFKSMRTDK